jgi:hypothetical protein
MFGFGNREANPRFTTKNTKNAKGIKVRADVQHVSGVYFTRLPSGSTVSLVFR